MESPSSTVIVGGSDEEDDTSSPCLASLVTCNFHGLSDSSEFEYVMLLLEREKLEYTSVLGTNPDRISTNTSRFTAVNNIFHTIGLLGFQLQTVYLSVTYLDRFLSVRSLHISEKAWATELLSVACLSLAAKLREPDVPPLSSFRVGSFRFDVKFIRRMELLILNALEWKMGSITPFNFLPYFVDKLFIEPPSSSTLTRIQELILAIMTDVSLMDHYPSAIALAAVLMSSDERLTRNALHLKINALPCSRFVDIEDVFVCFLIMQKAETKLMLPAGYKSWMRSSSLKECEREEEKEGLE